MDKTENAHFDKIKKGFGGVLTGQSHWKTPTTSVWENSNQTRAREQIEERLTKTASRYLNQLSKPELKYI